MCGCSVFHAALGLAVQSYAAPTQCPHFRVFRVTIIIHFSSPRFAKHALAKLDTLVLLAIIDQTVLLFVILHSHRTVLATLSRQNQLAAVAALPHLVAQLQW